MDEALALLEDIIDDLIEYDNGGSDQYTAAAIAGKCLKLRKLLEKVSEGGKE